MQTFYWHRHSNVFGIRYLALSFDLSSIIFCVRHQISGIIVQRCFNNNFKPFINFIFKIQKYTSYNRQYVVGCFYLMLMTIKTEKETTGKKEIQCYIKRKNSSKVHQSRFRPVLVPSAKYVIRAWWLQALVHRLLLQFLITTAKCT